MNKRHPRRPEPTGYLVRIELLDCEPTIWRTVLLASSMPLPLVHHVVQGAMGWEGSHLHEFVHTDGGPDADRTAERFTDLDLLDEPFGQLDEKEVTLDEFLAEPGDAFLYFYDFGDGWCHRITLERVFEGEELPPLVVLDGARSCPPEDFGGAWRYTEFLRACRREESEIDVEELREILEWLPEGFDDTRFAASDRTAAVVERLDAIFSEITYLIDAGVMCVFLDSIGSGVALTTSGRLKPAHVESLMLENGWDEFWIGKYNREDHTMPIAELHEWAREAGLVRHSGTRLQLTSQGSILCEDLEELADWLSEVFGGEHLYLAERIMEQGPPRS